MPAEKDPPPAKTDPPTLTDYVVTAVSPILIMLMVGSLTFFLVEVIYRGRYASSLLYTLFFFVGAAVLVCRIAVNSGYQYASIYGIGLGVATLIALNAYVEYPTAATRALALPINVVLMGVIWWVANKLVWDCTHFDEARKASGRGILGAAGIATGAEPVEEPEVVKAKKKDPDGVMGWWARYSRYREAQRQKPHTPGVWVVYFALAAVPLFALGQSLVPGDDRARRWAITLQMACYVGSGLGLLVTTSLLGLRKYLRERGAKIPTSLTVGWLGLGAALIVGFVLVGVIVPWPSSGTPLVDLGGKSKGNRKASEHAVRKDGDAGEGKGKAGNKKEAGDGKGNAKGGKEGGKAGEKGDGGGKGDDKGGNKQGDGKDGNKQNANAKQGGEDKANKDKKDDKNKDDQKGGNAKDPGDDGQKDQNADGDAGEDSGDNSGGDSPQSKLSEAFQSMGDLLRWVVWFVVAVAVIVGILIFFLKYLAPFTQWARGLLDWLRSLFARKEREAKAVAIAEAEAEEAINRPSFDLFRNPFEDGSARRKSVEELVEYTFAATDAWAWDRDTGRRPDETPTEFAARLADEYPALDAPARRLAAVYVRALYSTAELPAGTIDVLKEVWETLEGPVYAANA